MFQGSNPLCCTRRGPKEKSTFPEHAGDIIICVVNTRPFNEEGAWVSNRCRNLRKGVMALKLATFD